MRSALLALQMRLAVDDFESRQSPGIEFIVFETGAVSLRIDNSANHGRPHFHIKYKQEFSASYAIDTFECLAGSVPRKYAGHYVELGEGASTPAVRQMDRTASWSSCLRNRSRWFVGDAEGGINPSNFRTGDHAVVREDPRLLIEANGDIEVVGEAETGREATQKTGELHLHESLVNLAIRCLACGSP